MASKSTSISDALDPASLSPAQIQALTPAELAGMTTGQLREFTAKQIQALTSDQADKLSESQKNVLTDTVSKALGGSSAGFGLNPLTDIESFGKNVGSAAKGIVDQFSPSALAGNLSAKENPIVGDVKGLVGDNSTPAKKDPKKKAKTKEATGDTTLSELAQTLAGEYSAQAEEAIGSEGAQLANENQAIMGQIMPSLTGSTAYNAGGESSPAVQAAMDSYAKAYGTSEAFNSEAFTQSGIANEQYLATSPYSAYVQMLSQPGSEYFKEISPSLIAQLPESLQYALQQAQLGVGEGQAVPTPKGGWPASATGSAGGAPNATSALAQALTGGTTTVPGAPNSPSSLTTGNPNTPGQ